MAYPDKKNVPASTQQISDETVLKIAKEIAIKFIEVGRITPASFEQDFSRIHQTIHHTVSSTPRPTDK